MLDSLWLTRLSRENLEIGNTDEIISPASPSPGFLMKNVPLLRSSVSPSPSPSRRLALVQESLATPSGCMFCVGETLCHSCNTNSCTASCGRKGNSKKVIFHPQALFCVCGRVGVGGDLRKYEWGWKRKKRREGEKEREVKVSRLEPPPNRRPEA